MSRRKIWIGVGIPLGLLVVGVAMWEWWLPSRAMGEIRERLAERFGMECSVDSIDLDLTSVDLVGVRMRSPERAFELSIDELELGATPWGLALNGPAAISRVKLHRPRLDLRFDLPGAQRSLHRIRDQLTGPNEGRAAGSNTPNDTGRTVEFRDAILRVSDRAGALVDLQGGSGTLEAGELALAAEALTLGTEGEEQIELTGVTLAASRAGASLALESVESSAVRVVLKHRVEAQDEGEESSSSPSGRQDSRAALLDRPLIGRFVRVARALTGRGSTAAQAPTGDASDEGGGIEGFLRHLQPGFSARFSSVDVVSRMADEEEVPLARFSGRVRIPERGRIHLQGRGEASGGGEIDWDLRVRPAAYEAVGRVRFSGMPLAVAIPFLPDLPWYRPERAQISADLTIEDSSREHFDFQGRVAIARLAFSSRRLAPEPIEDIGVGLSGAGTWTPGGRRLVLSRGEVALGRARVGVRGQFAWPEGQYNIDLRASLPATPCGAVVEALPADLMQEVQGFDLSGHLSGRMNLQVDSEDLDGTTLSIDTRDGCAFNRVPPIADLLRVQGAFRHRVQEPDGSVFAMTTGPGTAHWVSRSGISPFFVAALLTREDGSFYRHGGFSVSSIRDALVRNLKEGRFVYGASTITMQLAKNLFLQRQKTLARKAQEVFLTWMLERLLSKDDIITLYANIVEYGRSLYGIRAAARRYFGRSAAGLSPAEATFLACILSRPKVYHGQLFAGELSGSMRSRMDRVLRRMGSRGRISPEEMAWGLAELPSFGFRVDGAPMREPWSPPLDEPQAEGDATTDGDPLPGDPERPPRPVGDEAPAVDDGSWEPNAWELGGPSAER